MKALALFAIVLLSAAVPASAAKLACSIHPAKDTPAPTLRGLAKISQEQAGKIALASIKARSKQVVSGYLAIAQGCLVYFFDIQVNAENGVEEIQVDAGTGKIIAQKHETAEEEAAERARYKAVPTKPQ